MVVTGHAAKINSIPLINFFLDRQAKGPVKDNGWDVKRPQAIADSKPAVPGPVGWRLSCSMGRTL